MAKEKRNDYFSMMAELAEYSLEAAVQLETIISDFHLECLDENLKALHAVEHRGDEKRHILAGKLLKEFITPIEREDIMAITNQIDRVTDAVEDVLLKIYMFDIRTIHADAVPFTRIIRQCCHNLLELFREFGNYKKSKTLINMIIEMNRLEEEGDALYISAVHKLHTSDADAREIMAWTEIYHCLERACDTCEQTTDLVEHVILKNT